jgi:hypothetical protein
MRILKWFLTFIAAAVLGAIVSLGLAKAMTGGEVQPVQAQEFLRDYYASAVRPASAERAWQMLEPGFRLVLPAGYDGFLKWYTNWHKVKLGELQPGGGINQFMATVTYVSADNQVQSRGEGAWALSCANAIQSHNPFDSTCSESHNPFDSTCSVRDIRMDYYGYQQNP